LPARGSAELSACEFRVRILPERVELTLDVPVDGYVLADVFSVVLGLLIWLQLRVPVHRGLLVVDRVAHHRRPRHE